MIDTIKIYGERNTGTNYLRRLIELNTDLRVAGVYEYGWKHGFPIDAEHARDHLGNVLFIFMIKNPYSWALSLKRNTHQVSWKKRRAKKDISLMQFLKERFEHGKRPVRVYTEKVAAYSDFIKIRPSRSLTHTYEFLLEHPQKVLDDVLVVAYPQRGPLETIADHTTDLQNGTDTGREFTRRDYYLQELWKQEMTPEAYAEINRQIVPGTMSMYKTLK